MEEKRIENEKMMMEKRIEVERMEEIQRRIWRLKKDFDHRRHPPSWREDSVVPIPKPGKDPSATSNYRPIVLTSCLCQTIERMVNDRLVHVLESRNLLSKLEISSRFLKIISHKIRRHYTSLPHSSLDGVEITVLSFNSSDGVSS
ncbi:uncharacterized protein PoB_007381400 [Plakobranchus ocellatus]|uniref:Uncharacterized protein n=1 Tax=Plakobranchus ocellatus TaxID=259542 RepID=A0AAV4DTI4_9GAST|nr:uncharacterized protein PoB_007381400 [Plakobranchus ocellatus]